MNDKVELEETSSTENKIQLDNKGRAYATGKRKNSVARVWLKKVQFWLKTAVPHQKR